MKCERVRELLSDYREGTLDFALAETISGHMENCASCRNELARLKNLWLMLDKLPDIEPPVDFRQNIVRQIAQMQEEKANAKSGISGFIWQLTHGKWKPSRGFAAVSAALVLAAILLVVPQYSDKYASGIFNPGVSASGGSDISDDSPVIDITKFNKEKWIERKMVRNSVWTSISADKSSSGENQYNIELSVNEKAILNEEAIKSVNISVFLVEDGMYNTDAVKNNKPEWQSVLEKGKSITIPVIADEDLDTTDLLILCKAGNFEFGQFIFLPSNNANVSDNGISSVTAAFRDVYTSLKSISIDFDVPVVANAFMNESVPVIDPESETLDDVLKDTLKSSGFNWLCADNTVYVDKSSKQY